MKVMIVGAGATGGFLANTLHEGGHEVSLVARGPHLAAIKAHGLRLLRPDQPDSMCRIPASSDPGEFGSQDLIITTVKAPALPGLLSQMKPIIDAGTPVITAMNGVFWWYAQGMDVAGVQPDTSRLDPEGKIASLLSVEQTMGMVIHSTNKVAEPGVILNRSPKNRFVIGMPGAAGFDTGKKLSASLNVPGLEVTFDEDIRRIMWRKLLRNLTTAPTSVLTGATAYDVLNDPDVSKVSRALFLDGCAVASAHGYTGFERDEDQVFKKRAGAHQKPSMSQDIDLGRPMEVDNILRIVQDFAAQSKLSVPTLDTVVSLVKMRAQIAGCYPS